MVFVVATARLPEVIGKYQITGLVGSGTQGVVLRAMDPQLNRPVAIKVLRNNPSHEEVQRLITEARHVSRLHHPNVVTLLDFGLIGKKPYLVFELLEGTALRDEIKTVGKFPLARAVILMSQLLGGIAAAHELGIVHCDLSPANIFITGNDLPKVMDFGLSTIARSGNENTGELMGTPRYLYPEPFLELPVGPQSDVFSLGAIFFEMLVGEAQFNQSTAAKLFKAIAEGETRLPSSYVSNVPALVDQVVVGALERDPSRRFQSARVMKDLLDQYRIARPGDADDNHSTVEFLLRRIRHSPGFSALSHRIDDVFNLTSSDSKSDAKTLSNLLAKDVTLTHRVLSTANSAMYGAAEVTNLPRAIVLMGLPQVRSCVLNALLQTQFSGAAATLNQAMVASFFTAVLSKELVKHCRLPDADDAFVCGMFHDFGKLLVIHYLPDEHAEIQRRCHDLDSEFAVCREVLGIQYHVVGQQIGAHWGLPANVLQAMTPLPRGRLVAGIEQPTMPHLTAAFCGALVDALSRESEQVGPTIDRLIDRVAAAIPVSLETLSGLLPTVAELTKKYASLLGVSPQTIDSLNTVQTMFCEATADSASNDSVVYRTAAQA